MSLGLDRSVRQQPCVHCGSGAVPLKSQFIGNVNGHRVFRCPKCRLAFVHPKLTAAATAALYSSYHAETGQMELSSNGERELFRRVLDCIVALGAAGELLDIGASYGHFLAMARDRGFSIKGLEIAADPCRYANTVLGVNVEQKNLMEAGLATERFHAITLLNVLEHLPDPHPILQECWRIAAPGAVIAIVVPSLLPAYPYFAVTRRLGLDVRVPTSAYDVPAHLSLFGPKSLYTLLQSSGWQDILLGNAPVIENGVGAKTIVKRAAKWIADELATLTANRLVCGYSLLAAARKAKAAGGSEP